EEPDLTAEEVRRRLRLQLSASRVSAILLEIGFTRIKSLSCRPSKAATTSDTNEPASPAG
ncbi:MAG: hypothetical protein AAGG46_07270, partial [Planctomycetota bacterium]